MRVSISLLFCLFATSSAFAAKLSDYSPYEYDVRFTNPVCKEYKYREPVYSRSGEKLVAKPKNVFCKSTDADVSAERAEAPIQKLLEWIADRNTKEIFFTYLSFSNKVVKNALCEAIEKRDVKVTFVIDDPQMDGEDDAEGAAKIATAKELAKCRSKSPENKPTFLLRGHTPGIGYAHNKIFMVNPHSRKEVKISFGSGNMTSGIVLHHENWHFITTSPESYFAQAHLCVMEGEIEHADSAKSFKAHMKSCLASIEAEPEKDIQPFFIPGDGAVATAVIEESIGWASKISIAAHRFSYTKLLEFLHAKLEGEVDMRLVVDDDILWAREGARDRPNMPAEGYKVRDLEKAGAQVKYMETNHSQHLLHHNKFIVFENGRRKAVYVGAGNFTGDAFNKNLENFYYVTIPEVVQAMKDQYDHLYNDLATAEVDMPKKDVLP